MRRSVWSFSNVTNETSVTILVTVHAHGGRGPPQDGGLSVTRERNIEETTMAVPTASMAADFSIFLTQPASPG